MKLKDLAGKIVVPDHFELKVVEHIIFNGERIGDAELNGEIIRSVITDYTADSSLDERIYDEEVDNIRFSARELYIYINRYIAGKDFLRI